MYPNVYGNYYVLNIKEGDGPVTLTGELTGLSDGLHGFHVHQVLC